MTWYWVVTQAAACSSSIESVHESSMMNHQFNRFRKTEVCFSDENSRILFHDHLITFCYTIRGILKWFNIIKVVFKVLFHVYSWIFSTFHPIVILGTSVERYQGFHGQGRGDWNDGLFIVTLRLFQFSNRAVLERVFFKMDEKPVSFWLFERFTIEERPYWVLLAV